MLVVILVVPFLVLPVGSADLDHHREADFSLFDVDVDLPRLEEFRKMLLEDLEQASRIEGTEVVVHASIGGRDGLDAVAGLDPGECQEFGGHHGPRGHAGHRVSFFSRRRRATGLHEHHHVTRVHLHREHPAARWGRVDR